MAGEEPPGDLAAHVDVLVIAVGKTEALAAVAVEWIDDLEWDSTDQLQTDRLAYLIGTVSEAAAAAVAVVDRFRTMVADQQPAEAGDDWER